MLNFTREEVIAELDRVSRLSFGKKVALRRMLHFIVEVTLEGKSDSLKEYTIATLVFGKAESFDPRMTSLVRTQATKLREALIGHYSSYPTEEGPWVWVPAGSYRAVFHQNPVGLPTRGVLRVQPTVEAHLGTAVHIGVPNVFPRTNNLDEIARAVVRLQYENFGSSKLAAPFPGPVSLNVPATQPESLLEVEQTIVELNDRLLLTVSLTAGRSRLVLFSNSVSISWNGNVGEAIAAFSAPLSQFAATCASLVTLPAFRRLPDVVTELKESGRVERVVGDIMPAPPGVLMPDSQTKHA